MWPSTRICELFGIEHPIVQAPMAGSDTPELAAAVTNAGGMGSMGFSGYSGDEIREKAAAARATTNGSLNYNFLVYRIPTADPVRWVRALEALAPFYEERGISSAPDAPGEWLEVNAERVRAAIAGSPRVMSFHFALPEPDLVDEIKAADIKVICSATSADEARHLEDIGCDAIIAQGWEAGGHRGIHSNPESLAVGAGEIGTLALVPAVVDAVSVPVIAAGGISDARGIAAAFMLGADGVQMGTAFLQCPESGICAAHRRALAGAKAGDTRVTRGLSGRPARAIRNRLTEALSDRDDQVAPYPFQLDVIAPLRETSNVRDDGDFIPLWAGQGVGLTRAVPAAEFVQRTADAALRLLGRSG